LLFFLFPYFGNDDYIRVKVDTEDYRERRKTTLENLAKNIAFKVKRTKHSVSLEPMNPYERRIIHSALQNDKYVTTHSEGEEPYRHVIVSMKKYDRSSGRSSYGSSYDKGYSKSYDSEDKE
jgi:spoIIIJ-associated protein